MAQQHPRKYVTRTIPHWTEVEIPEGVMAVAENRTRHLEGVAMLRTLKELLRDAYLQGMHDALTVALKIEGGNTAAAA